MQCSDNISKITKTNVWFFTNWKLLYYCHTFLLERYKEESKNEP